MGKAFRILPVSWINSLSPCMEGLRYSGSIWEKKRLSLMQLLESWLPNSAEPSQHTKPSALTRFVLESPVSARTHASFLQYMRIAQIAHSDHIPDPKGKWHNRDTDASHLHLRRTASYWLRWGSTLVLLGGNVGRLFHKWTSQPLYMKIRLTADFAGLEETGGKQTGN